MPNAKVKTSKLDIKDPAIKDFIEAVHKNITEKADNSQNRSPVDFVQENRIFELFCADKFITPKTCAEKMNRSYRYNLTPDDVIKKFDIQGIKTREERIEFIRLVGEKVDAFIKLLLYKNKNDIEAFDSAHIQLMKKFDKSSRAKKYGRRATELEKFTGRIFCFMLFTKFPELNIYKDIATLEEFGNGRAHSVYQVMFKQIKHILKIQDNDEKQQENELLRSTLQMQETDIKNLNENFEAQLQERMAEFFSNFNSDKYGNILDAVISAYGGIQQLRKKGIEVPIELSDLFPLINNLKNFVRDNEISPIIRLGSVHQMTKADIEKISGEYNGSPFLDSNEIKTVKVISPGWYYKSQDIQISRPRLKEERNDNTD